MNLISNYCCPFGDINSADLLSKSHEYIFIKLNDRCFTLKGGIYGDALDPRFKLSKIHGNGFYEIYVKFQTHMKCQLSWKWIIFVLAFETT